MLFWYSTEPFDPIYTDLRTTQTTSDPASRGLRPVKSILSVRQLQYLRTKCSVPHTSILLLPLPTGTDGIIKKIRETVGDNPVYLSIDVCCPEHPVLI